jgi:hypothetical protein
VAGAGCGGGEPRQPERFPSADVPVLIVELADLPADPDLPACLAESRDAAHGRLSPSGFPSDTAGMAEGLASDAMLNGYLCMLADVEPPEGAEVRSNMVLRSLDSGVAVSPSELREEVDPRLWRSWQGRQELVRRLLEKYRPDVTIMRLRADSAGQVAWLIDYWAPPRSAVELDIVVYSPPDPERDYRGWAALLGPSFTGGQVRGLTYGGLRSTARVVLDMPDSLSASEGVAAWAHLRREAEKGPSR